MENKYNNLVTFNGNKYRISDEQINEGDLCINLWSSSIFTVKKIHAEEEYMEVKFHKGGNIAECIITNSSSSAIPKKLILYESIN